MMNLQKYPLKLLQKIVLEASKIPLDYMEVQNKLKDKLKEFQEFNVDTEQELNKLSDYAKDTFKLDYNQIIQKLNLLAHKGAIPSKEYMHGLIIKYPETYRPHQEMINWAKDNIQNKIVVGTDGSQIYQVNEINIPVALVQVVRYCNEHSLHSKSYSSDRKIDVLPPKELYYLDDSQKETTSQQPVDAKRFYYEMKMLVESMQQFHNKNIDPKDILCLTDGSLVLSFLYTTAEKPKKQYFEALEDVIKHSSMYKYPIVGYVDSSAAKDIANMLFYLNDIQLGKPKSDEETESDENELKEGSFNEGTDPNQSPVKIISDVKVIDTYCRNMLNYNLQWGDRTCAFICDRNDIIYKQYPEKIKSRIAFFYIKLNSVALSRVEFPEWCLDYSGMVENIAHLMRVESVIGSGYPYTLDQCHHKCVIHSDERNKFLRLFQVFGDQNGLKIKINNKSRSKMVRY